MKHLIRLLTLALLIVSAVACDHQTKVVSPIAVPNLDSLRTYLDKAAQTHDPRDQFFAACYYLEQYNANDSTKAIDLLIESAANDYPWAATELGYIYSADSTNTYYNIAKGVEYYQLGAKNGSDGAMIQLANLYINGRGVETNYQKALQLRADATLGLLQLAEAGDAAAQCRLGCNLADGIGVSANAKVGYNWIKKAADQGYVPAYYRMGIQNYYGYGGVEKNYDEAFRYFQRAAAKNHPNALYCLAVCYKNGDGIERNERLAFVNFLRGAELGDKDAMFGVACAYQDGNGTDTNYREALKWYKKCADLGNLRAQNNIGSMYENGQGVVADNAEAFKWYLKAANGGSAFSQSVVGTCYFFGKGVERDLTEAFEWYKKAAKNGDRTAMHNLAVCYQDGIGTVRDMDASRFWYEQSNN